MLIKESLSLVITYFLLWCCWHVRKIIFRCFYVEYRALNAATIRDKFPIYTTHELGCANVFSKLYLCVGYNQIWVHQRDTYTTTFCIHDDHFEFLVTPFDLKNGPTTF